MVSGGIDYLIELRFSNMTAYREFLGNDLASLSDIMLTQALFVAKEIKHATAIPLPSYASDR
jgi:DNA-binding Lrp family transcriptional regulator